MSVAVTAPLLAVGIGSAKAAMDMDSLRKGLDAVSGSSAATEQQLVRLNEVAKLPGLGFQQAIQGSISLQAAGLNANLAERALKAFGNALATVGKGKADLDGVNLALTQMVSKGKVVAQDINQIQERVPQIRQAMKAAFGTADTEELQKQGISSEIFVNGIIAQLEKLPTVTGGVRNDFENLTDTIQKDLAKLGEAVLPPVTTIINTLLPAIEGVVNAFHDLPPGVQQTIVVIAAVTAAIGPAAYVIGFYVDGIKKAKAAVDLLVAAKPLLLAFFGQQAAARGVETAAVAAETTATVENTAAKVANTAANQAAGVSYTTSGTNIGLATTQINANTAALAENTAAAEANAVASKGLGGAGGLGGFLRSPGGILTIGAAAVGIAHFGNEERDRRMGLGSVSFGATMNELNPWHTPNADINRDAEQAAKEVRARWGGMSPHQKILAEQNAVKTQARQDFSKSQAAEYEALLKQTQASIEGVDREGKAEAELKQLIPVLSQRRQVLVTEAAKLKGDIAKDPKASEDYYKLQGQIADLQGEENKIRLTYAQTVKDRQEKAHKAAEKLAKEVAHAAAKAAKDRAEADQRQYESGLRAQELTFQSQLEAAKIQGSHAEEGQKAAAELAAMYPVIENRQRQIAEDAKKYKKGSEEYAKREREWWKLEGEQNTLVERMQKERETDIKKAAEEKKKQIAAQNKQIKDQLELVNARQGLAEAMLANNPFLSDQQKKQAMVPLLFQQLKGLGKTPEGETELDKVRRYTEIAQAKGQIYTAYGLLGQHMNPYNLMNHRGISQLEKSINQTIASGATEQGQYKPTLPYSDSYLKSQLMQSRYGNSPETAWAKNQSGGVMFQNNFVTITRKQLEEAFYSMLNQATRSLYSGTAPE
jgi:tape measure domain-containing protein